jgi:hypothetical protein
VGGIIFPHSPACRTLFVPHAGSKTKRHNEGEEELPGAGEAVRPWSVGFSGGAAVVAVSWLTDGGRGVAATFFLLPAVSTLLLLFVSFAPSVSNVLLSLQWRHGGAGAAGGWWRCLGSRDGGSKQR